MKVTYIDHMGSDLSVVNAARVSFNKKSEAESYDHPEGLSSIGKWTPRLSEKDQRLIKYLAKHDHWTPFGHTAITLHIKAPIFVARQLGKHQVGLVWNEVSRRYVTDEPEFYVPEVWRKAAENVKQGSSDEAVHEGMYMGHQYADFAQVTLETYQRMLAQGVCPEQARMVLPQSMYTGSLIRGVPLRMLEVLVKSLLIVWVEFAIIGAIWGVFMR